VLGGGRRNGLAENKPPQPSSCMLMCHHTPLNRGFQSRVQLEKHRIRGRTQRSSEALSRRGVSISFSKRRRGKLGGGGWGGPFPNPPPGTNGANGVHGPPRFIPLGGDQKKYIGEKGAQFTWQGRGTHPPISRTIGGVDRCRARERPLVSTPKGLRQLSTERYGSSPSEV